ncbi:hypothetical protein E2C01_041117 [Portunus trituberculatus]|uniref:Uncharacterized protein n=1 Tax=Portunus trituberculatus TaxID=210409 RepID=A0A5B7FQL5_PORTR|nr:hypothetical protein [Portunus trituberculatus]
MNTCEQSARSWFTQVFPGEERVRRLGARSSAFESFVAKLLVLPAQSRTAGAGTVLEAAKTEQPRTWAVSKLLLELSNFSSELFPQTYAKNSTLDDSGLVPPSDYVMPTIKVLCNDVFHALVGLNPRKAYRPDGVPPLVLKNCASMIAPFLPSIVRQRHTRLPTCCGTRGFIAHRTKQEETYLSLRSCYTMRKNGGGGRTVVGDDPPPSLHTTLLLY